MQDIGLMMKDMLDNSSTTLDNSIRFLDLNNLDLDEFELAQKVFDVKFDADLDLKRKRLRISIHLNLFPGLI